MRNYLFGISLLALSGSLLFWACSSENDYAHDVDSVVIYEVDPEGELPDSSEVSELDGIPEAKDGVLYFQQPGTSTSMPKRKSSSSSAVLESSSSVVASSSSAVNPVMSSSSVVASSSSATPASSSDILESSSADAVINVWDWSILAKDYLNPNIVYDLIVDVRDWQVYHVVNIANRRWMAQNLNYNGDPVKDESWCYEDVKQRCNVLGRLYTWKAAKVACPEGWRLPSPTEWQELLDSCGSTSAAGRILKSTIGWFKDGFGNDGNGTDSLGFSALPAGSRNNDGKYSELGKSAYFWKNSGDTYGDYVSMYSADRVDESYHYKTMAFSVRCIEILAE